MTHTAAEQPVVQTRAFRTDLREEFRRLARAPRDDVSILAFNAALVTGCWFLLPLGARDWLFELHGPMAFALVLQSWMLADTPATNVLGNDVPAALRALPDPRRLRRLLRVKATALAVIVGVVSALTSIVLGVLEGRYAAGVSRGVFLVALSFGTAAVSQWLGILLPYHRHTVRWRWNHRRPWRTSVRWMTLVIVPYTVVPVVSAVLALPVTLVEVAAGDRGHHIHLTGPSRLFGALFACLIAGLAYPVGSRIGASLAARRARSLQAYLSDGERG